MRAQSNLLRQIKLIWVVQSCCEKQTALPVGQIIFTTSRYPVPTRGAFRDRHERGMGCGGRGGIERRTMLVCGRRSRVVLTPRRWRQVLRKRSARRRWQKSPVTGESTK